MLTCRQEKTINLIPHVNYHISYSAYISLHRSDKSHTRIYNLPNSYFITFLHATNDPVLNTCIIYACFPLSKLGNLIK